MIIAFFASSQTTLSVVEAAAAAAAAAETAEEEPLCFTRATFIIGFLLLGEFVMSKVASFSMSCSVLKLFPLLTLLFGLRGKE